LKSAFISKPRVANPEVCAFVEVKFAKQFCLVLYQVNSDNGDFQNAFQDSYLFNYYCFIYLFWNLMEKCQD